MLIPHIRFLEKRQEDHINNEKTNVYNGNMTATKSLRLASFLTLT
jgi:hypothetical protein